MNVPHVYGSSIQHELDPFTPGPATFSFTEMTSTGPHPVAARTPRFPELPRHLCLCFDHPMIREAFLLGMTSRGLHPVRAQTLQTLGGDHLRPTPQACRMTQVGPHPLKKVQPHMARRPSQAHTSDR